MSKISKIKCGICSEVKEREKKKKPDGTSIFVIPNTSIEWGHSFDMGDGTHRQCVVCPDCVALEYLLKDPNSEMSSRTCQDCGVPLPKSRYLKCEKCNPEYLRESENDYLYFTDDDSLTAEEEEFFEFLVGVEEDDEDNQGEETESEGFSTGESAS